jgi:hypothetical protein
VIVEVEQCYHGDPFCSEFANTTYAMYKTGIALVGVFMKRGLLGSANNVHKRISKAIPVIGLGHLLGFGMSRIPHCLNSRVTDGG